MKLLKENEISSPYDLREMLWYIIPGATLVLLIFLFEYWFAVQIRGVEGYNKNDTFISQDTLVLNAFIASENKHPVADTSYRKLNSRAISLNSKDTIKTKDDSIKISQDTLIKLQNKKKKIKQAAENMRIADSLKIIKNLQPLLLTELHTPVFTALSITHSPIFLPLGAEKKLAENWILSAIYLLLLLTICYILGHITYIIGTFIYERGLISKGYSYPYVELLGLTDDEPENRKNSILIKSSQGFYKGLFFWVVTIFIVMFTLFILWGHRWGMEGEEVNYNYKIYKYIVLLLCILFIVIPVRLKFILFYLTESIKDKKRDTPKINGPLYWVIVSVISISAVIIFQPDNIITFKDLPVFFLEIAKIIALWPASIFLTDESFPPLISLRLVLIVILITEVIIREYIGKNKFLAKILYTKLKKIDEFEKKKKNIPDSEYHELNLDIKNGYNREIICYSYFFIRIYNLFGNEIDKFSNHYFHTQSKFDTHFIKKYKESFNEVYQKDFKEFNKNNYWFSKFFVMENSAYLSQQVVFWENTARFIKSLSASFLIAFMYCSISFMIQYRQLRKLLINKYLEFTDAYGFIDLYHNPLALWDKYHDVISILILISIAYFVIALLIIRYYLYIYDNRYTRMVLRSFVAIVAAKEYNKQFHKLGK